MSDFDYDSEALLGVRWMKKDVDSSKGIAFGYEDFYVVGGSIIPANLGVNPSLTITAMAEHAMSKVPPRSST